MHTHWILRGGWPVLVLVGPRNAEAEASGEVILMAGEDSSVGFIKKRSRPLPDGRPHDAARVALAKKVDGMACCSSQVMAIGRSPT